MNIQLSIKIDSELKIPSTTVLMTYKPTDFQYYSYYGKKSLEHVLELGNTCPLSDLLKEFVSYIKKDINIGERLKNCSKVLLFNKKIDISNLLNTLSFQTLNTLINHLTTSFIKHKDFYDFSIGIIKNTTSKTENELENNLKKVKRKINDKSNVTLTIENIDTVIHTKSSYFSFRDTYSFNTDEIKDTCSLNKHITKLFNASIEPFSDIFMEKIITDSFAHLRSYNENQYKIYSQLERLAYEININKECNDTIISQFAELCKKFFTTFTDFTTIPPMPDIAKRQLTVAVSVANKVAIKSVKFDFNNFETYNNTYYQKILNLKKEDLPIPEKLNPQEILNLILRTNRYFDILKLCNFTFSKFLEENTKFDSFDNLLYKFKECCELLTNQVCYIYFENDDILDFEYEDKSSFI